MRPFDFSIYHPHPKIEALSGGNLALGRPACRLLCFHVWRARLRHRKPSTRSLTRARYASPQLGLTFLPLRLPQTWCSLVLVTPMPPSLPPIHHDTTHHQQHLPSHRSSAPAAKLRRTLTSRHAPASKLPSHGERECRHDEMEAGLFLLPNAPLPHPTRDRPASVPITAANPSAHAPPKGFSLPSASSPASLTAASQEHPCSSILVCSPHLTTSLTRRPSTPQQ